MEYFKDEVGDLPITEGEVTEIVELLLGGRASRVDEIHPEFWMLYGCFG